MKYLSAVVVAVILFLGAGKAEARGVAIYNTGEDIVHVSDIKEEVREEVEKEVGPGVKIGIIYNRFGLFWMDIWRWDARWVLYVDDSYVELPKEELEALSAGSLSKPITMTLPPGLIVLVLGGIGFGIFAFVTRGDEADESIYSADENEGQAGQAAGQQPQHPGHPQQPQQGYAQPGQPQPGQPGQPQQGYAQPGQAQQPQQGYAQPGQPQQGYAQPGQPQQPGQYAPQPGQPGYDPNKQG